MVARAASAEATGERILDAAEEVFWERPTDRVSLDEVAARAGVSVQTVIRRFGAKEELLRNAAERGSKVVRDQRDAVRTGDVPGAVDALMEHYEDYGDRVLRLLAEEPAVPALGEIADRGRRLHRDWCARVFSPALTGLEGVARDRRLAQLVAVCDVYTWKLLRRDAGLSRRQTGLAMVELLRPLTDEG